MRILDRIIVIFSSVLLAVLCVLAVGVLVGSSFAEAIFNSLRDLPRDVRIGTGIFALVVLIAGIYLLRLGLRSRRRQRAIVRGTSLGEVRISLVAVENLVRRAARQVRGIREVDTFVDGSGDGIEISVDILVAPDTNIPEICDEVQGKLEEYVRDTVGVGVTKIRVNVRNIATEAKTRVE